MSTYVMSDIHGCYDEFMAMFEKIHFSGDDKLIIAGDYVDRGPDSDKMLDFICENQDNPGFFFLKGNHDVEFAGYVDLIVQIVTDLGGEPMWDDNEYARTAYLLTFTKCIKELEFELFDYYETVKELIFKKNATLGLLKKWSDVIKSLGYVHKETIEGKEYVIVHAGYIEKLENHDFESSYDTLEEFYIYARDDAYIFGGSAHATIIAGHTPTILKEEFTYNDGKIYTFYDEDSDCRFFDIDCGGVYGHPKSNFAAIRLGDEECFYLREN